MPADVVDVALPAQRHREIKLLLYDLECAPDAALPARTEPVEERAADTARAERSRLEDVLARADAAVEVDLDPAADRVDDLGQRAESGFRY